MHNRKTLLFLSITVLVTGALGASPSLPGWWSDSATEIIDSQATENNYAPVTLGQLKHVAAMAREHLEDELSNHGGAGQVIDSLVFSFETQTPANFAPATLGQLKAVAKPFYDRLLAVGYDTRANLIARGYPGGWEHYFPWDPATPVETNYALANIGQLKMVFSFDLDGHDPDLAPADDYDIPDVWKIAYFGHTDIDAYDDPDGDGYPVVYEWKHNTDPSNPNSRPQAHYIVDRTQTEGGNIFHDIKPAVEQAKTDEVDFRIIEVAPGIYEDNNNVNFTISDVKLLLISRDGPDETIIQRVEAQDRLIRMESESAISGFIIRDFEGVFISVEGIDNGLISNCRFGGRIHSQERAVKILESDFIIRHSVFTDTGGVQIGNQWAELANTVKITNSTFTNNRFGAIEAYNYNLESKRPVSDLLFSRARGWYDPVSSFSVHLDRGTILTRGLGDEPLLCNKDRYGFY